jgi:hypothetical protein
VKINNNPSDPIKNEANVSTIVAGIFSQKQKQKQIFFLH